MQSKMQPPHIVHVLGGAESPDLNIVEAKGVVLMPMAAKKKTKKKAKRVAKKKTTKRRKKK